METSDLEEKEVTLVSDCVRQLDDANKKIKKLEVEMKVKGDVCVAQQEENTNLISKVITVETNYKKVWTEKIFEKVFFLWLQFVFSTCFVGWNIFCNTVCLENSRMECLI